MATPSLILITTPIGNLDDLSPRAARALAEVDVLYCEDTRRTRQLLSHLGITGKKLVSLHEHNEQGRIDEVVSHLENGASVGIVSDAGMPVISDPGQKLVEAVADRGFTVTAIPGPNAAMMALTVSGLPSDRFSFEGFLPASGKERRERLEKIGAKRRTVILYESPHRVVKTVEDLTRVRGEGSRLVIARELTKLHEEIWRGQLQEALAYLESNPPRGEYTLVLEGVAEQVREVTDDEIIAELSSRIAAGLSKRDAVHEVTDLLGVPHKRVYSLSLGL